MEIIILAIIVALTFIYEFGNGMNDAANAVSTIVATKAMSLRSALLMSAFGNFLGPFLLGVAVAETIGRGIVETRVITPPDIVILLISAIVWAYLATLRGLPISVTHCIVGSLVGIGLVTDINSVVFSKLFIVLAFVVIGPVMGIITAFIVEYVLLSLLKNSSEKLNYLFRKLQIVTSFLFNMSHGANDSQNGMGIIAMALFVLGFIQQFTVPLWVILTSALAISLGTYVGGVRVIRMAGMKIMKLKPYSGFCSEGAAAFTLAYSTILGIPVSSSHSQVEEHEDNIPELDIHNSAYCCDERWVVYNLQNFVLIYSP
ncbi:MAG: inorganic phosphate transporter [Candidatus Anstonellales archaeon]